MRTKPGRFSSPVLRLIMLLSWSAAVAGAIGFDDVTDTVGLTGVTSSPGQKASWVDFDRDGWVDLYVSGTLWKNLQGKTFVRMEGLLPAMSGAGMGIWGDYDNDGYPDIYCYESHRLYRNIEGREVVDETRQLPPGSKTSSRGAAWGDFNRDGFIDLYIGGYENWKDNVTYPDVILMNNAGKGFTLARTETGYRARGVTACDFDQDGDLDIYVSNYRLQPNLLWLNNGRGRFKDVGESYGAAGDGELEAWGHTIGSAWGDFDNDGYFDLFVGNFSHPPASQDRAKFLRNGGPRKRFHFEDRSILAGLDWQESFATPALGDFDNDGFLDFVFTTVYPGDHTVLYRNNGDWTFRDVTSELKMSLGPTYQAAWADYDNDGHLDLIAGGRLFRNRDSGNNWIKVRLAGDGRINRSAIGSQVRIKSKSGKDIFTRQVEGGTGEGNQNDLTLHFGLGQRQPPLDMEVAWTDGTRKTMALPQVNQLIEVRPGD